MLSLNFRKSSALFTLRTLCFLLAVIGTQCLLCYAIFANFGIVNNCLKYTSLFLLFISSLISLTFIARIILISAQSKQLLINTIFSKKNLLKDLFYFNSLSIFMGVIGAFLSAPVLVLLIDVYSPFAVLIPALTSLVLIFPSVSVVLIGGLVSNFVLIEPFLDNFYLKLFITSLSFLVLIYFCLRFSFGLWYCYEFHKNIYAGLKWSWLVTKLHTKTLLKLFSLLGVCLIGFLATITICFDLVCGNLLSLSSSILEDMVKTTLIITLGVVSVALLGLLLGAHAYIYNQLIEREVPQVMDSRSDN